MRVYQMSKMSREVVHQVVDLAVFLFSLLLIAFAFSTIPAWITHVITCLSDGSWGFLIAGALFVPIGVIHGYGIWLGFF